MYFGRNDYDADNVSEARTRLQAFQGATAISSNAYFGREEDEDAGGAVGSESLLGDGNLANLEMAARDVVTKVLSNPDVQNVGETIRAGALKVSRITIWVFTALILFVVQALRLSRPNVCGSVRAGTSSNFSGRWLTKKFIAAAFYDSDIHSLLHPYSTSVTAEYQNCIFD